MIIWTIERIDLKIDERGVRIERFFETFLCELKQKCLFIRFAKIISLSLIRVNSGMKSSKADENYFIRFLKL